MVQAYATVCTKCGQWSSQLDRVKIESNSFTAPDGTAAIVVENDPDIVTFHIPSGEYQGYYRHDKLSGKNTITAG